MALRAGALLSTVLAVFVAAGRIDAASCSEEYSKEQMQGMLKSFAVMKITGFSLLGAGGASIVSGVVLVSTAEWESHSTGTSAGITTQDPQGGAGLVMLAVGLPMSSAGMVLGILGSRKVREYKGCLDAVTFNVRVDRRRCGIALTCAF